MVLIHRLNLIKKFGLMQNSISKYHQHNLTSIFAKKINSTYTCR